MLAAGDRVSLPATVIRTRDDTVSLQLPDGQAVHISAEHLSPPPVQDKALRPPARKATHAANRVPD